MIKKIILGLVAGVSLTVVSVNADTYTVKEGDTLSAIAEQHNTTVQSLDDLNDISDINKIYVGDIIRTDGNVVSESALNAQVAPVSVVEQPKVETPAQVEKPVASDAKAIIRHRESRGDYSIVNPTSGTYGAYQLLPVYLKGDYSIANQERTADVYVAERYGSWENALAFHNANNWY